MGPYGVDRAVHSLEFTDCENGLGKSSLTSSVSVSEDGDSPNNIRKWTTVAISFIVHRVNLHLKTQSQTPFLGLNSVIKVS